MSTKNSTTGSDVVDFKKEELELEETKEVASGMVLFRDTGCVLGGELVSVGGEVTVANVDIAKRTPSDVDVDPSSLERLSTEILNQFLTYVIFCDTSGPYRNGLLHYDPIPSISLICKRLLEAYDNALRSFKLLAVIDREAIGSDRRHFYECLEST